MSFTGWDGYAIAGQSNAHGNNGQSMSGVRIGKVQIHNGLSAYVPGIAADMDWWNPSTTPTSPRIGPAAGIAELYASRPTRGARICQHAVGSTTIAQWISTYAPAHIADMVATGWTFDKGLIWAQGENESGNAPEADAYDVRLATLFGLYRAEFPGLKVAVVQLASGMGGSGTTVRARQASYCASDPLAALVDIDDRKTDQHDSLHYNGPSQRICGIRSVLALEAL